MATIRQIETAIENAAKAGDQAAVGRLKQLLEAEKAAGAEEGGMPLSEALSRGAANIPSSAGKYASDIGHAVMHPIDTISAMGDLGAGALREGARAVLPTGVFNTLDSLGSQEAANRASDTATAVGRMYKDRYGSWDGFKRAVAEDPVGVAADISVPVTLGGNLISKAPGVVGSIGRGITTVGRNMDPITATGNVLKTGGRGIAALGGWASGVGDAPLEEAYKARRAGGIREQAFLDNMRSGGAASADVVDEATRNLDAFDQRFKSEYARGIQSTRNSTAAVDWTPIRQAVNDATLSLTTTGGKFYGGEAARRTINKIHNLIYEYRTNPSLQTPEALDALKQEISDMQVTLGPSVPRSVGQANRVATQVADAIRQELVRLDPNYATTMAKYAEGKRLSEEIQRALSLNDKASVDTTLRKLQSTMRNNVQTNYGYRGDLLNAIDPDQTLRAALAGQALNTWGPRGIARAGGAAAIPAAVAYMTSNPGMVAAVGASAPLASPRVVGEVAGLLGAGARKADEFAASNPGITKTAKAATSRGGRYVAQEAGGIANEQDAMIIDAKGNVYDRKARLIRRGKKQ